MLLVIAYPPSGRRLDCFPLLSFSYRHAYIPRIVTYVYVHTLVHMRPALRRRKQKRRTKDGRKHASKQARRNETKRPIYAVHAADAPPSEYERPIPASCHHAKPFPSFCFPARRRTACGPARARVMVGIAAHVKSVVGSDRLVQRAVMTRV